jgi:hypothetical protein
MQRSRPGLLAFLIALPLLAASACEDESNVREFAVKPYGVAACDTPNRQLESRRELRLFVSDGYDIGRTATALQRYYRHFGITFYQVNPVRIVDTPFVEDLDADALTTKLQARFPGVDLSDKGLDALSKSDPATFARLYKELINLEFAGALEFLRDLGGKGQNVTNVVVLRELFTPGSPSALREKVLGISISPILLRELQRAGMDETGAFAALDFPADFSPTVFISDRNVNWLEQRAGAVHRDLVLAHEFGHSAGLVHRMDTTNLMNPSTDGTEQCTLAITGDQIAVMREGLGLSPVQARVLTTGAPRALPATLPSLLGGVLRGDPDAQRALLAPLHD